MPTTTSPLKRPSRLRRLLASLHPPARAGPLPVQTGFPTSLADLVVKNHGRLKKPRRRHRATSAPPPVEPALQQRRDLSAAQQDGAVPAPAPPPSRPKGAGFTVRPELLAVGGVMALALLVIWSKRLVAAATLTSVALFWIESFRSPASRRRPRPETTEEEELDSQGYGLVSPIREAESSPAETPRPTCAAASDTGSEVSSLWAADTTDELACDDPGFISPSKRKEKRRSLRKLLAKKLHNRKRGKDSCHGGESGHPVAGEVSALEPAVAAAPAEVTVAPAPEAVTEDERHRRQGGGALPLAVFVPVILTGLVAGKLPAVALAVLCAVFFTSVERAPDVSVAQASGDGSDPR